MSDQEDVRRARARRSSVPVLKPPPHGYRQIVPSPGGCSVVRISHDLKTVIKTPFSFYTDGCDEKRIKSSQHRVQFSIEAIEREKEIFRHLGNHPAILECLEISDVGIVFPYKQNGNLRDYLADMTVTKPSELKTAWIRSALAAFDFIHSKGVLQADVSARNFLVNDDLSIVLCDFSGSAIGDKESSVAHETRYSRTLGDVSLEAEIFAIGSLIYEISTEEAPYKDLKDEVVQGLFEERTFPDTSYVVLGDIVMRCWTGDFSSVRHIIEAIASMS